MKYSGGKRTTACNVKLQSIQAPSVDIWYSIISRHRYLLLHGRFSFVGGCFLDGTL